MFSRLVFPCTPQLRTSLALAPCVHLNSRAAFSLGAAAVMSSSGKNTKASGLTAEQSKALAERQVKDGEEAVIKAMKEMYSCNPQTVSAIGLRDISLASPLIECLIDHIRDLCTWSSVP